MTIIAHTLQNYQVSITAGRHSFTADEPAGIGDDAGPSPYDLLLSSLAACKVMTAHMYARRKDWPLEAVHLTLTIANIHAKDCEGCLADPADPDARISLIETKARFQGDLTPDQIARLTEILDRCPVHRTLTGEIMITTTVEGISE
jgi:putative redox protein